MILSAITTTKTILSLIPSTILWFQLLFSWNNVGLKQLQRLVQLGHLSLAMKNTISSAIDARLDISQYHLMIILSLFYIYIDYRPMWLALTILIATGIRISMPQMDVWYELVPSAYITKAAIFIALPIILIVPRMRDHYRLPRPTISRILCLLAHTQVFGLLYFHPFIMYVSQQYTVFELLTGVYSTSAVIISSAMLSRYL